MGSSRKSRVLMSRSWGVQLLICEGRCLGRSSRPSSRRARRTRCTSSSQCGRCSISWTDPGSTWDISRTAAAPRTSMVRRYTSSWIGLDAKDRRRGGEEIAPAQLAVVEESGGQSAVGDESIPSSTSSAEVLRGAMEDAPHLAVELADSSESGGERQLGDGEVGVVEQAAGEVSANRARQIARADTKFRQAAAAKVSGRHPEPVGEIRFGAVVECAVEDQGHCATDQVAALRARRHGAVGTALEARPESGRLGCCRQGVPDLVVSQRFRATSGSAVNAGGVDGRDELRVVVRSLSRSVLLMTARRSTGARPAAGAVPRHWWHGSSAWPPATRTRRGR